MDNEALLSARGLITAQLGVPAATPHPTSTAANKHFEAQLKAELAVLRKTLPDSKGTITSTGLNLFAQFAGKYYHCMRLLPQVAAEVFDHLLDLFDYYVYAIFMTFFPEEAHEFIWDDELPVLDQEFKPLISHLRRLGKKFDATAIAANQKPQNELLNLIDGMKINKDGELGLGTSPMAAASRRQNAVSTRVKKMEQRVASVARLPFNPKLSVEASMWGINARSVAVESVLFLIDVMWFLRPRLSCFMGDDTAEAAPTVDGIAGNRMREFYAVRVVVVG